jgi:hypothetical protein
MSDRVKWVVGSAIALVAVGGGAVGWRTFWATGPLAESPQATIEVSTASYGLNCSNAAEGNATPYVAKACDGKRSCSFAVRDAASNIGDYCPGVPKDFRVTYVCGDRENSAFVSPEAAGATAFLICGGS